MAALRFLRLSLQELSRCALWLSAWDHQGSKDPEEKSQHNKQRTDRQTDKNKKTNKKTGTKCILIWGNGSWLTTANVNAPSSPPTHECLSYPNYEFKVAFWGVSSLGFYWGLPGGHGPHSGLVLPGPCPAEIMYRLLGLRPVLKGPRPHNTALWLPQDTMDLVLCPMW